MEIKYILYFLTGGTVVSVVTYYASEAKGLLAAFIANLPVTTLITFLTIYLDSGQTAVVPYAQGLVIMLLPWLAYILSIIFFTKKIGLIPSLIIGITLYICLAFLIINAKKLF